VMPTSYKNKASARTKQNFSVYKNRGLSPAFYFDYSTHLACLPETDEMILVSD
jgi:hypothetical protein